MASYIVTGIHAAARAGKYGKVSDARAFLGSSVGFRSISAILSSRVYFVVSGDVFEALRHSW